MSRRGIAIVVSIAAACAAAVLPATAGGAANSALSGPGLSDFTTTWSGTGDADVRLPQIYCDVFCEDPEYWPGAPGFLWDLTQAGTFTSLESPPSPPTLGGESGPPHAAEELALNCRQYYPSSGFVVRECKTLSSFTANGSPSGDDIEVTTAVGAPPINVTVSAGAGNDLVLVGGNGSRNIDGGDEPFNPDDPERDLLSVLPTAALRTGDVTPNTTWNVNLQTGSATPSSGASPINSQNFEGASMFLATPGSPGHTLIGNAEPNILSGNGGNDLLRGHGEDDSLGGGGGDDTLEGGDGDDVIYASFGSDTLTGGPGVDEFFCADSEFDTTGNDLVTDNVPGEVLHNCDIQVGSLLPDATIRRSNGDPVGNDVYEATPSEDQTMTWSAKRNKTRTFVVGLENDGSTAGSLTVEGCGGNQKFKVTYLAEGINVTQEVGAGTYVTDALGANGEAEIEVKVKPKKDRGKLMCDVSARSGDEIDAVRAELTAKD